MRSGVWPHIKMAQKKTGQKRVFLSFKPMTVQPGTPEMAPESLEAVVKTMFLKAA